MQEKIEFDYEVRDTEAKEAPILRLHTLEHRNKGYKKLIIYINEPTVSDGIRLIHILENGIRPDRRVDNEAVYCNKFVLDVLSACCKVVIFDKNDKEVLFPTPLTQALAEKTEKGGLGYFTPLGYSQILQLCFDTIYIKMLGFDFVASLEKKN
jgi:hypothetical protein